MKKITFLFRITICFSLLTTSFIYSQYDATNAQVGDELTVNGKDEPEVVEGIARKLTDDEKKFIINNGPTFKGTIHNGVAKKIHDAVNAHNKMQEELQ